MKLSLHQVARALDSPLETIERWIRQGRIPIQRNGDAYTFDASLLKKWAIRRKLPLVLPSTSNETEKKSLLPETLLKAMQSGEVIHEIEGHDAFSALSSAVGKIPGLSSDMQEELLDRLIEREKLASTGIGKGIAIPHPRTPLSTPLAHSQITTCFLREPINFNAIDDNQVFIFFILLSPNVKYHLHLISRLSYCLRNNEFVTFLRQKPPAETIFKKIAEFESALDQNS